MRLTRRGFVVGGGAAAMAAAAGRVGWPAHAQTGPTAPRVSGWQFESVLLQSSRYDTGGGVDRRWQQIFHPTLMRVDDKLGSNALAKWYLWFWTHDKPSCRLYVADELVALTAPGAFRPWDGQQGRVALPQAPSSVGGCSPESTSAPSRRLYNDRRGAYDLAERCHYAAGDVAWDPVTSAFYSTPHEMGLWWDGVNPGAHTFQKTALIKSTDGITWTRVSGTNENEPGILPLGAGSPRNNDPLAAWDSYQIAYGRFLRDYEGNIARYTGDGYVDAVVWLYRGQKQVKSSGLVTNTYAIGAGATNDFSSWSKVQPADRPLFNPAAGALCGVGSALLVGGEIYLVINTEDALGGDPTKVGSFTTYMKRPLVQGSVETWVDGPGTEMYKDPDPNVTGGPGCYALDGSSHVLVYDGWTGTYGTSTSRMRISLARNP